MNDIDDEKALLNETPDFDNQLQILEEEHKENVKKRRIYILISSMFVFIALVFYMSYSRIYVYREYGLGYLANCGNVNIKMDGSPVPNINISDGKKCIPIYNIDYYNNRKATFNIDLFGDRSNIFNPTNQMDETGTYCVLNCDRNGDGWPDYNLDLNGDGIADLNIVKDPQINKGKVCDLNCDTDFDTIPDLNINTDGDGIADVNIYDYENDKLYNVDYKGNRKPMFNIKNNDGTITNPVIDARYNPSCSVNCDLDGDGSPDYNIEIDGKKINEIKDLKNYNIDVDGDGKPDVNVIKDDGSIDNEINKPVIIDGKTVILNEDFNLNGYPDHNIDIDGDGKPDLNITDGKGKCIYNCDTNGDGKPDTNIKYPDNTISIRNLNIDYDYDTVCDVNCDINYDLVPDLNIDTNGDIIPDINIDYDHDGKPDFNIDTDGDGYSDLNIDALGIGKCNFNCQKEDGTMTNIVDKSETCTKNCDTNKDGIPDTNVDINGDGVCDFNCDGGTTKLDNNHNFILDSEEQSATIDIEANPEYDFSITNPLDITAYEIEPGWSSNFVIYIKNDTYYAVSYNLEWRNVQNTFTEYNLDYYVTRSNTSYIATGEAPYYNQVIKNGVLIRPKTTIKYVLNMEWKETGTNQNVDSGKIFKGIFSATVNK